MNMDVDNPMLTQTEQKSRAQSALQATRRVQMNQAITLEGEQYRKGKVYSLPRATAGLLLSRGIARDPGKRKEADPQE